MRPKSVMARQIALGQKADAANQTKPQSMSPQQLANNKLVFILTFII